METFSALYNYWPFARGVHRSPVDSPHKGQRRGALMFSLICAWINSWVNNREAGNLRRHHAHYDVSVMAWTRRRLPRLRSPCRVFGNWRGNLWYSQRYSITKTVFMCKTYIEGNQPKYTSNVMFKPRLNNKQSWNKVWLHYRGTVRKFTSFYHNDFYT